MVMGNLVIQLDNTPDSGINVEAKKMDKVKIIGPKRGFKDQGKYDEHVSQHVKNHAPGVKRIKLDTPEEIAKWREERRKNYPTVSNVAKKIRMMEEREERGEVLETAQFGRMKRGYRGGGRGQTSCRQERNLWNTQGRKRLKSGTKDNEGKETERSFPTPKQTLMDRDPLGALAESDLDSDNDEAADRKKEGLTVTPKNMTSGLGALVASYGSASDSDSDQEPEALPIQKASKALEENQAMLRPLPSSTQTGPSQQGLRKLPGSRADHQQPYHQAGRPHRAPHRRGREQGTSGLHRATLLEMLLAPEIRHERNVVLQCVRYIVQNSFFGWDHKAQDSKLAVSTIAEDSAKNKEQLPINVRSSPAGDTVIAGNLPLAEAFWQGGHLLGGDGQIHGSQLGTQVKNTVSGGYHNPTSNSEDLQQGLNRQSSLSEDTQNHNTKETCTQLEKLQTIRCDCPREEMGSGVDIFSLESKMPPGQPQEEEQSSPALTSVIYEAPHISVDTDQSQQPLKGNESTPVYTTGMKDHCAYEDLSNIAENTAVVGNHGLTASGRNHCPLSDSVISEDCCITAHSTVAIGDNSLLAENAVIVGDHNLTDGRKQCDQPSSFEVDDEIWENA
ncbi:hypothetical protein JZ751_027973 [Albula glossodonta]|uniref:FMR1-interacting protein 1 conserved domain-containing protein n=1 Tax=Albula glossodonta TaxID=121402 RepID=A0A8T2PJ57_9TELE|nr:hypothetical protein JZ751_027973 [Albula glossodonta]